MSSTQGARRSVVITGIGAVSPIGVGREAFWENLSAGRSGISHVDAYNCTAPPGGIGGEVKDFNDKTVKKQYLRAQRKSLKVMCREIQMGAAAALMAVEDSGLDMDSLNKERVGVEYGANLMFFTPDALADPCRKCFDEGQQFDFSKWGTEGMAAMEPLWMLKYLPNMPACHIAIFVDAHGPNNSVTMDDASPGAALTEALNIMERGWADVMIAGGTGTTLHPTRAVHARFVRPLGYDPEHPEASCKPFDVHRSGPVIAEGAGSLLLEEEEHARARGATIYGRLLSGATSCVVDPDGTKHPERALVNAIRAALSRAGIEPKDIGHINAHGLGSRNEDVLEAQAYREVFGDALAEIPVTSVKGYIGNGGAGFGFLESAASLLHGRQGEIPQTLNCTEPDPEIGLNVVTGGPQKTDNPIFLKVNFSRAGQASVVVMEAVSA